MDISNDDTRDYGDTQCSEKRDGCAVSKKLDYGDECEIVDYGEKLLLPDDIPSEIIPKLDMEFTSEIEAYTFYNNYARQMGFSVRKGRDHKNHSGRITDKSFICSCQGQRLKDKRNEEVKNPRPLTRCGCRAEMKIVKTTSSKYQIVKFVVEHSHKLASPNKSHLLRSQRCLTDAQIAEIDMADNVGITPKTGISLMASHVGGRENLGFIPIDYKNYLRTKRAKQMKVGETGGVLEYLQEMRGNDPNFFYAIQVDSESLITNIFWADGKMMIDYEYFGDVVCFDTTYRKMNENRPFGLFVGVNNHKQTIIFGAALLYDETIDTFTWLFESFIKAMGGKKPKCMLTDQDAAMANALASCWPETHHRLCLWHIFQNAAKHLYSLVDDTISFSKKFQSCIYDHENEADFHTAWLNLRQEFHLEDNNWLDQLFSCKEKWALVYGRETFSADMTTTQRSECMNNQLKRYVNPQLDMLRFFQHFNRLVADLRYEELKKDFSAFHTQPVLAFESEILKHAAQQYTPSLFEMFQYEMRKIFDSEMDVTERIGSTCVYSITPYGRKHAYTVKYDSDGYMISCSCRKFEFVGILCSHALKVMVWNGRKEIPAPYILKRWTKIVKKNSGRETESLVNIDAKEELGIRYKILRTNFNKLAARAAESEETYAYTLRMFDKVILEVDEKLNSSSKDCQPCVSEKNVNDNMTSHGIDIMLDPKGIKRKKSSFRISSKRKVSAFEKAMTKRKTVKNARKYHPSGNVEILTQTSNGQTSPEMNVFSVEMMPQYTNQELLMLQQYPLQSNVNMPLTYGWTELDQNSKNLDG